jgi:hypothetical protein
VRRVDHVDIATRQHVNRTAQSAIRIERVDCVPRRRIDSNRSNIVGLDGRLRQGTWSLKKQKKKRETSAQTSQ